MMTTRNEGRMVAQFMVPALYSKAREAWTYSAIRVTVTDRADQFLVQYLLSLVRVAT